MGRRRDGSMAATADRHYLYQEAVQDPVAEIDFIFHRVRGSMGVVIEAKRGEFLEKGACLFVARGRQQLRLRGDGATLRMHKEDYHRPPYELAEWRHALSIRGCEDVLVEGLTIRDSGGDGIYLGAGRDGAANRNVTIRGVSSDWR